MKTPHYLRFVQALALASLPACSAEAPSSPATTDPAPIDTTPNARTVPEPPVDTALTVQADAATHEDAGYPHTSGPIVPPEQTRRIA